MFVVPTGVYYEAIVTEDGAVLAVPEFTIDARGEETTPGELVRRHLIHHLDATIASRANRTAPIATSSE